MTNPKALSATKRVALSSLFENPEITAMAAICEILQELPDEAARMRVMRWSFSRFSEEFKRPLVDSGPVAPRHAAERHATPDAVATPIRRVSRDDVNGAESEDFGSQISELEDLFSSCSRPLSPARSSV